MPVATKCRVCGHEKMLPPSHAASRQTCSRKCKGLLQTATILAGRPKVKQPDDHRIIVLAGGQHAMVSIEDFEAASRIAWSSTPDGYVRNRDSMFLHQLVLQRMVGDYHPLLPDHENRNPLDNRRENLRAVTKANNATNKSLYRNSKSGLKGVRELPNGKWQAYITCSGTLIRCGNYGSAHEAAYVRDQFAMQLHREFAVLNYVYE